MEERWLPVVGHLGYEISDHGRVRSLTRAITYVRTDHHSGRQITVTKICVGKMLSPSPIPSGHMFTTLGRNNWVYVHTMVLEAFVGPAPIGHECCHWDDDPANNHLGNLRWGTRADNMADFKRNHGRHQAWPEERYQRNA
jgi:hypothetical protein